MNDEIEYRDKSGKIVLMSNDRFGQGFYVGPAGMVCSKTDHPLHYVRVKRPVRYRFDDRMVMMILSEELRDCDKKIPHNNLIVYDRHILGPEHVRVIVLFNHYGRFIPVHDMTEYFLKYPDLTHTSGVSEPCAV